MANNISGSPIILDSTGTVYAATVRLSVQSIRWVAKTAQAGNELILKDGAGRVVFHSVAAAANHLDVHMPQKSWRGLTVDTIGSGVVYIEL
jgi:hypothetical protein